VTSRPIITLTTDFGVADHFVGAIKGVILSINPDVELVDLCHEISSHDILGGAFTLAESCRYFPPGAIHLVVVDPGVGSARRPILASSATARFVAPDNGVLSLALEHAPEGPPAGPATPAAEVRHINEERYFRKPVSNTFHGRDIFAPVAAWLATGVAPQQFGPPITDYARLTLPKPERRVGKGVSVVRGTVIRIDRFGNVMTNFTPFDLPELFGERARSFRMAVNGYEITRLVGSFSEARPSEVVILVGSSDYLEMAANRDSAARILGAKPGTVVEVTIEW